MNDDLSQEQSTEAERKMQFLYALRSKGVTDKRVLAAMESIDRAAMCKALSPVLAQGILEGAALDAAIAATAEGYSFPTNLDNDPPLGGLAPETQNALFHRALAEGLSPEAFARALADQDARRQP